MKKIINILIIFLPLFFYSQKNDSLILSNNKTVYLSPVNERITGKIVNVKVSRIKFTGKLDGFGKPNSIRTIELNAYLKKKGYKPIGKICCSYYVKQGENNFYIRAYKKYGQRISDVSEFNALLYIVSTETKIYSFLILI